MYNPDKQYRLTIIRGKSQTEMEDLLPIYASIVHKYCPCEQSVFNLSINDELSQVLFNEDRFIALSKAHQKTVRNHVTEIAGSILGLYYTTVIDNKTFVYESESCSFLYKYNDFPSFFRNLCLRFQFPNGTKKVHSMQEEIAKGIRLKPFCFILALLNEAEEMNIILEKQEVGYYVLNNLDVLQGRISPKIVLETIISDRDNNIKKKHLAGSRDWQHIKEQFNMLELTNMVDSNKTHIWINNVGEQYVDYFIQQMMNFFDVYSYSLDTPNKRKEFIQEWCKFYGSVDNGLLEITNANRENIQDPSTSILSPSNERKLPTTTEVGNMGEEIVFKLETERVRKYKGRLANKVLSLGKTRGLGYDILSLEADENIECPEFNRYIEVKTTVRVTEPTFNEVFCDSIELTAKEWIAAKQYKEFYNIYRVYFTKTKTIIIKINNPYKKSMDAMIDVYATKYRLDFDSKAIDQQYE